MAVVNRNSAGIANLVATPRVVQRPPQAGGALLHRQGIVTPAADDSATSVFRCFRLPSNAVVNSMQLSCAIASTAGAVNIGIYDTLDNANGGTVVSATTFASAQSLSAAALSKANVLSNTYLQTYTEKYLWEVLGLSSDPCKDYDVGMAVSTTFNGGPTSMLLQASYVQ